MCMSKTPSKSLAAVAGAINDSPTVTPDRAIFDNCCRVPISSTSVLSVIQLQEVSPHPGTDVMTSFLKSTNGPIIVGLDRLHKHI